MDGYDADGDKIKARVSSQGAFKAGKFWNLIITPLDISVGLGWYFHSHHLDVMVNGWTVLIIIMNEIFFKSGIL